MKYLIVKILIFACIGGISSTHAFGFLKRIFHSGKSSENIREGFWYQVKPGDNLWRLSRKFNVSEDQIKRANKITGNILPVKKIYIPRSVYTPGTKDLPPKPAKTNRSNPAPVHTKTRNNPTVKSVPVAKPPKSSTVKKEPLFQWPVAKPVLAKNGKYGQKKGEIVNTGILLEVLARQSVTASRTGKVVFSGFLDGYGNTVILDHKDDYFTVYAHLGECAKNLKYGSSVTQGQNVGHTGLSGNVKKPVLHFEIRHLNKALDPLLFLKSPQKK
jgi:murein DD-endopeptidase MepM/ murein hydrolase activator NlpD